jgi:hypothetical protein
MAGGSSVAFTVGVSDSEIVRLAFRGRMHEGMTDYWDGNWLLTQMTGVVSGCRFTIAAALRADEIRAVRQDVERLSEHLSGRAQLSSMEDWISILMVGDGSGLLTMSGFVAERPGGHPLPFVMENYDRRLLPALLAELAAVESRFPVLGSPG